MLLKLWSKHGLRLYTFRGQISRAIDQSARLKRKPLIGSNVLQRNVVIGSSFSHSDRIYQISDRFVHIRICGCKSYSGGIQNVSLFNHKKVLDLEKQMTSQNISIVQMHLQYCKLKWMLWLLEVSFYWVGWIFYFNFFPFVWPRWSEVKCFTFQLDH